MAQLRSPRVTAAFRARTFGAALGAVVVLGVGAAACSGDDTSTAVDSASGTTQVDPTPEPAAPGTTGDSAASSTTTTADPADPTDTTLAGPPSADDESAYIGARAPDVTTALYWVRPPGGEPRSIPGYTDPEGQPTPLLAYGSVTNNGAAPVVDPIAITVWRTSTGETVLVSAAHLSHPDGTPVAVIEPGESIDVWVVASGLTDAVLSTLSPEFVVGVAP